MEDIQMPSPAKPSSDHPIVSQLPAKRRKSRESDDSNSLALLELVIQFKSRNGGANPTPTNMKPLYDSVKSTLSSASSDVEDLTLDKLYKRLRNLRFKYYRLCESGPDGSNLSFFEMSRRAWGNSKKTKTVGALVPKKKIVEKDHEEMDDIECGGDEDSFECLNHNVKEYWQAMQLNASDLEMGLKSMDKGKARLVEGKWVQHSKVGLKIQAKQCKLNRELFAALVAAQKGTK